MLDFGALPPEINSGRMYFGPGSRPMMAAASAWDALAAQLELYAAGYSSTLSELQGQWSGGAAIAMASAAAPYVAWATTTAAQAEQAAGQARAAAAAFETAFAATVPPPVVAANRLLLATLVATNFVGQNTPAIAATEADYAEMWVQDAAAMYGYAASSSVATALTPFGEPPQTTNTGGQSAAAAQAVTGSTTGQAQTTLSELMAALPQQVQALAATADPSAASPWEWLAQLNSLVPAPVLTAFTDMNTFIFGPTQPFWQWVFTGGNIGSYSLAAKSDVESHLPKSPTPPKLPERLVGTGPGSAGMRGPVLVSVGQATSIGRLSVPPSWASATPADNPAAEPLASEGAGFRALPPWAANAPGGTPTAGMAPMANGEGRRTGNAVFRMRDRRFKMPRPAIGG